MVNGAGDMTSLILISDFCFTSFQIDNVFPMAAYKGRWRFSIFFAWHLTPNAWCPLLNSSVSRPSGPWVVLQEPWRVVFRHELAGTFCITNQAWPNLSEKNAYFHDPVILWASADALTFFKPAHGFCFIFLLCLGSEKVSSSIKLAASATGGWI
jgi:hypothetical protein